MNEFRFLGIKVLVMLVVSLTIGVTLFFVDLYFSIAFQIYLSHMGLISIKNLNLPYVLSLGKDHPFIMFALISILRLVLISAKSLVSSLSNQNFVYLQRMRLINHAFHNQTRSLSSHEVMAIFTDRIVRAGGTISDVSSLLVILTSLCLMIGWGAMNAWRELCLGLMIGVISLVPVMVMSKQIKGLGREVDTVWLGLNKNISEGLKHYFFLFYHGKIHDQVKRANDYLTRSLNAYEKFFLVSSLNNITPQIIGLVALTFITSISIKYWNTSPAVLLSFLYIYIRIAQGAGEAFYLVSCLKLNINNYKFIREVSLRGNDSEKYINYKPSTVSFKDLTDIKLEGFRFKFHNSSEEVISGMNLHIRRGTPLVIKGASGAGKSTLLSILLGYYVPSHGSIHLNGNEKEIDILTMINRNEIAYVGPDPFLFDDSVYDNLTFGLNENVSREHIDELLKRFGLYSIFNGRKDGLEERLGEHSHLSTGQRQRLSLIRALLRKPEVLVLDEATSNLDTESELIIVNYLKEFSKNAFVIIVTHRENFDALNGMEIRL